MAKKREKSWDELLTGSFEGTKEERLHLANTLQKADFFQKDYGVLAFTLAEMQTAGKSMTTAVQNLVASKVVEQFDNVYGEYKKNFQPMYAGHQPLDRNTLFAKDRFAYLDALSRPINLSYARDMPVSPNDRTTAGQLMPHAFAADTVYGGMRWLGETTYPQIVQQLTRTERNEDGTAAFRSVSPNFAEEINTAWEGGYNSIPNYMPPTDGQQNNFAMFFGQQAGHAVRDARKAERIFRGGNVSLDGMTEGSTNSDGEEVDGSIPGDSVGVDAFNTPTLSGQSAVSGDNSFTQPSYFPQEEAGQVLNSITNVQQQKSRDQFGATDRVNVQTGMVERDTQFGQYGKAQVTSWLYGLDAKNAQVFGVDPASPAGQAGMQEGAYIQSFQRILKGPNAATLADALQNGNGVLVGYQQPNKAGELEDYVSLINPAPINGRSADQGREDNWIETLSKTLDPEMGRTMTRIQATWKKTPEGNFEYVKREPIKSTTEGNSAIPLDLWTNDKRKTSGMYQTKSGEWALAPLSQMPSEEYKYRVQVNPQSINAFGKLYEAWHTDWTETSKTVKGIEAQATSTVMSNLERAKKAGAADRFPALETAIQNETNKLLAKAGMSPSEASFVRGGSLMANELRTLEKSIIGSSAEVAPDANNGDAFEDLINSRGKTDQPWAGRVSDETVDTELNRTGERQIAIENRMRGKNKADIGLNKNYNPGGYQGGGFGTEGGVEPAPSEPVETVEPAGRSIVGLGDFKPSQRERPDAPEEISSWTGQDNGRIERTPAPARTELGPMEPGETEAAKRDAIRLERSSLNSYSRFEPGSEKNDDWRDESKPGRSQSTLPYAEQDDVDEEDILGSNPGRFANETGLSLGLGRAPRVIGPRQKGIDPQSISLATINRGKGVRRTTSVEDVNHEPIGDDAIQRKEVDRQKSDYDNELNGLSENTSLATSDRDFQQALKTIADPNAPEASNAAVIGSVGGALGYNTRKGQPSHWGAVLKGLNAVHPENFASFRALQPVRTLSGQKAAEAAKAARLIALTGTFRNLKRTDVLAHIRLGETPRDLIEASQSRGGFPRDALKQASSNLNLDLKTGRGDEIRLGEQLETIRAEQPQTYAKLKGSVLADASTQLKTAEAWRQKLNVVPAEAVPTRSKDEEEFHDASFDLDGSGEEEEIWEARNADWVTENTPAARQYRAARAQGLASGDMEAARNLARYPLTDTNTPQPARNLPHFAEGVDDLLRSTFNNPDVEESGFLIGRKNDQGGVDIFDVVKPEQRGEQNKNRVITTPEMVAEANKVAQEKGGFLAGFVHTHPDDASREPGQLRPSNTDVLTNTLKGAGPMNNASWGEDTAHVILNPRTGSVAVWNQGEGTMTDVTGKVREPSNKPARVGLRSSRKAFKGIKATNSFEGTPPPAQGPQVASSTVASAPNSPEDYFMDQTPIGELTPPDEPPDDFTDDDFARSQAGPLDSIDQLSSAGKSTPPPANGGGNGNGKKPPVTRTASPTPAPKKNGKNGTGPKTGIRDDVINAAREKLSVLDGDIALEQRSANRDQTFIDSQIAAGEGILKDLTDAEVNALVLPSERESIDNDTWGETIAGNEALKRRRASRPAQPTQKYSPSTSAKRVAQKQMILKGFTDREAEIAKGTDAAVQQTQLAALNSERGATLQSFSQGELVATMPDDEVIAAEKGDWSSVKSPQGQELQRRDEQGRKQLQAEEDNQARAHTNPTPKPARAGSTQAVEFPLGPKPGQILERVIKGTGANGKPSLQVEHLEARAFGDMSNRRLSWGRLNEQTGEFDEVSGINWGTIQDDEGTIVADVNEEEYNDEVAGRASRGLPPKRLTKRDKAHVASADEKAKVAARNVTMGDALRGESSRILGTARENKNPKTGEADGTFAYTRKDVDGTDIETLGTQGTERAYSIAQGAVSTAFQGLLPSNEVNRVATIKDRIRAAAFEQVDKEVDEMIQKGADPSQARAYGAGLKEAVGKIADKLGSKVVSTMAEELGIDSKDIKDTSSKDIRLKSMDEVQGLVNRSPAVAKELASRGHSVEQVWNQGKGYIVTDEAGNDFDIGSGGFQRSGGGFGGRGGGLFGKGAIGSVMYGAYMLNREWQMAAGPVIQSAQQYGKNMSALAPLMYEGKDLGSTDAGFQFRQEAGQEFMGKAAYSSFGAFMDLPYKLSQTGNLGAARLIETGGIASGLGFGAAITGNMMKMMPGMEAIGGVVAKGGLMAATALMGATIGMEAYNAFIKDPSAPDVTASSMFDDGNKLGGLWDANRNRMDSIWGSTYEEYTSKGRTSAPKSQWEWGMARGADFFKVFSGEISPGELAKFMNPDKKELFLNEAERKEAQKVQDKITGIRQTTLEDTASLTKAALLYKRNFGELTDDDWTKLGELSKINAEIGLGTDEAVQEGMTYAAQMGALSGTDKYRELTDQYAYEPDRTKKTQMSYSGSKWAGLSGQWQSVMGPQEKFTGAASRLSQKYGFDTQAEQSAVVKSANAIQVGGYSMTPKEQDRMGQAIATAGVYQSGVISNAVGGLIQMGAITPYQGMNLTDQLSSAGMSAQDASIYDRMQQGDLGAYSFKAWQTGNMDNAFQDRAGRPISQYYGREAIQNYNHWAPTIGLQQKTAAQYLGVTGTPNATQQGMIDAWNAPDGNGGMYGIQKLANNASYAASMASAGNALKGIALQENFYWGSNAGGTWNNPTSGSSWGIEDRSLAMQDANQRANFADQWTRMSLSNDFGIKREANQSQRMMASQDMQNYQWSYSYNQFNQSQTWAKEDWQTQDTSRNLNFSWQMEDINENIRFATGRERKQAVKQRDRAALSHNMEEDVIDTQRERQKELWSQQEEQYQKQRTYNMQLQQLDIDSFELNKDQRETFYKLDVTAYERRMKEYEEEKKLSEELRELQRKFQFDQLQLSKESAGIQAAAAAAQKIYSDGMLEANKNTETFTGTLAQLNTYNNAFRLTVATTEMIRMMDNLDTNRVNKLITLIQTIGTVGTSTRFGGEDDGR